MKIEALVILGAGAGALYGFGRWVMIGKPSPEPWGPEVDAAVHQPEAVPICHRCFAPQDPESWFCPECGAAEGRYNNYLPFINIFSEGEVFRAGVSDNIRPSFLTIGGYLLLSASAYFVFAPVYWYFLFKNLNRHAGPLRQETAPE
jgi:hypothetical protein